MLPLFRVMTMKTYIIKEVCNKKQGKWNVGIIYVPKCWVKESVIIIPSKYKPFVDDFIDQIRQNLDGIKSLEELLTRTEMQEVRSIIESDKKYSEKIVGFFERQGKKYILACLEETRDIEIHREILKILLRNNINDGIITKMKNNIIGGL